MNNIQLTDKRQLMVCHECDALQNVAHVPKGDTAMCICCGERLFKNARSPIEKPLALTLACLILFVLGNLYPILQLTIAGIESETTLIGSALMFFELGGFAFKAGNISL